MAATKTKAPRTETPKSGLSHEEHGLKGSVNRAEVFYQNNARIINIVGIAIILVIGGYFGYKNLYLKPREAKAVSMVFKAQQYFARDSFRLALEGDGNNYGYLQVIQRYGNTKVGNLARYSAGVCYVRMGEYQKGIDYLKKFDAGDNVVQAMAYGLMGDAYMELGQTDQGIAWYKKAASYNDNNVISPIYLMRAGLASEKAGKTQDAIAFFQTIKDKYPLSAEGRDMDKYLARLGVTQ
jgi:tetratricopeptide (TPR) repeat protein